MFYRDHPDVAAALSTGYPRGAALENDDTPEARLEYIEETRKEFLEFIRSIDPGLVDEYIETHYTSYKDWLN